ncbi:hypothetical protein LL912_22705 [Niabella sp. CC-SYL272]|uniref:hypothetical protein n=1 Tax=Niabella agricola TaxID=2891571 RepID=UPI001F3202BA|nr:hypothetical protein [Niabella agricola]MCF3111615.1 hypothetical protein [Niabella agricola]
MLKTFLLTVLFVLAVGGVSFATENTVTDVDHGKDKPKNGYVAENKFEKELSSFSLRSEYQYRGDRVLTNTNTTNNNYINLNTSISYQKGTNIYIVPYKKKVILNRFTFNPNEPLRNLYR